MAMLLTSLPGCISSLEEAEEVTLKILSLYDQSELDYIGLGSYLNKHPEVSLEYVDMPADSVDWYGELEQRFLTEQPDIVISDSLSYGLLAGKSHFLNMNTYMEKGDYSAAERNPAVEESIKQRGNGTLEGLSPYFQSNVLLYNADLFQAHHIQLPSDQMSWDEIMDMAELFTLEEVDDNRAYGYYAGIQGDPLKFVDQMAAAEGLSYMDGSRRAAAANSAEWKSIYESAIEAMRKGALYLGEALERQPSADLVDIFLHGDIGMVMGGYDAVQKLENRKVSFQWGFVTQPVAEGNRQAGELTPWYIFSINKDSAHANAAWQLIDAINGKESVLKHGASNGLLPVWKQEQDEAGLSLAPFYLLKARTGKETAFREMPEELADEIRKRRSSYFEDALIGKLTVDEALAATQSSLQRLLAAADEGTG